MKKYIIGIVYHIPGPIIYNFAYSATIPDDVCINTIKNNIESKNIIKIREKLHLLININNQTKTKDFALSVQNELQEIESHLNEITKIFITFNPM